MNLSIDYRIYVSNNIKLARTMIINSVQNAAIINARMSLGGYPYNPNDKTTWKYYMNMAGIYHPTNEPMQVKSLDTGEMIDFTVENLSRHVSTWRSYQYGTDYYNQLLAKYPYQPALIKGVLNPIPLDVSTTAKDFEILWYDESLVEEGEEGLIADVQDWIWTLDWQWYHNDYAKVTEDLYHQYHMGVMAMMLPSVIMGIRIKNTNTNKAHSFHIWSHILSHADLKAYMPYFNRKQMLWLYRNIVWIKHNAGKQYTFDKLIDNLLTERNIPLGGFDAVHNTEKLLEDINVNIDFRRKLMNMQGRISDDTYVKSTESILEAEIPLAKYNIDIYKQEIDVTNHEVASSLRNNIPTKVLESKMRDRSGSLTFPLELTLLNEWIHFADRGLYTSIVTVTNPSTGLPLTMSIKEAFVLYLYATWQERKVTLDKIPPVLANNVVRLPRPTFQDLKDKLGCKYVTDPFIKEAIKDLPYIERVISTEAFYKLAVDINHRNQLHRDLYCYRPHMEQRAHIEKLVLSLYQDRLCDLFPNTTYKEFFDTRGWRFPDLPPDEWGIFAKKIMTVATGMDTANIQSLADIQRAMIDATLKLSSYTIHVLRDINSEAIVMLDTPYKRIGENTMVIKLHNFVDNQDKRVLRQSARPKRKHNVIDVCHRYAVGNPHPSTGSVVEREIGVLSTSGNSFYRFVEGINRQVWEHDTIPVDNELDKDIEHKVLDGLYKTPLGGDLPPLTFDKTELDGLHKEPLKGLDTPANLLDGLSTKPKPSLSDIKNKLLKGLKADDIDEY